MAFPHLARFARELVDTARDHDREPRRSMHEAHEWAVQFGPFDLMYEVIRRLTMILVFCVLIGDLTAERWSIASLSGGGNVQDPRSSRPESPGRRVVDTVHGVVNACLPPTLGL